MEIIDLKNLEYNLVNIYEHEFFHYSFSFGCTKLLMFMYIFHFKILYQNFVL